ncbi:MAG TPA: hypothetical protein VFP21_07465 [Solirubrobacterales bacterium]|nr:hypothetical protein [Solirubrobacterales bacterium]
MHKKLMLACMAIAAFAAFVVAPAASATPVLTENGVAVSNGASIKGTNTGNTLFTIQGFKEPVECTHAEFKGTLTANTGTTIAGEIPQSTGANYTFSGTGAGGDCTSPIGDIKPTLISALCLHAAKGSDNVTINGCGSNPVTFRLDSTTGLTCNYSVSFLTGTYSTTGDATINLSEQEAVLEKNESFLCPGAGKLDMDFDLYTTDGTTLAIS